MSSRVEDLNAWWNGNSVVYIGCFLSERVDGRKYNEQVFFVNEVNVRIGYDDSFYVAVDGNPDSIDKNLPVVRDLVGFDLNYLGRQEINGISGLIIGDEKK